jgi:uncharacterized protein (UPF0276 family)
MPTSLEMKTQCELYFQANNILISSLLMKYTVNIYITNRLAIKIIKKKFFNNRNRKNNP